MHPARMMNKEEQTYEQEETQTEEKESKKFQIDGQVLVKS